MECLTSCGHPKREKTILVLYVLGGGEAEEEERCDTEVTLITNSLFKKKKTVPFESFVGRELI